MDRDQVADASSRQTTLLEELASRQKATTFTSDEVLRSRIELVRIQFEYAWRAFQHHAQQRVSIFNFFIVFSAASVNAYALLLNNGHWILAAFQSLLAMTVALCFLCLDRRNEELVHMAEDVLRQLESDVLFRDFGLVTSYSLRRWPLAMKAEKVTPQGRVPLGLHMREEHENAYLAKLMKDERRSYLSLGWVRLRLRLGLDGRSPYQHGYWFSAVQVLICFAFLVATMAALLAGLPAHHQKNDIPAHVQPA